MTVRLEQRWEVGVMCMSCEEPSGAFGIPMSEALVSDTTQSFQLRRPFRGCTFLPQWKEVVPVFQDLCFHHILFHSFVLCIG